MKSDSLHSVRISASGPDNYSIAYLSEFSFCRATQATIDLGWRKRNSTPAAFFTHKGFTFDGFKLPDRTVVVKALVSGASALERIRYGKLLVHEIAHAKGDNEGGARLAERRYLQKLGLKGPSKLQIYHQLTSEDYTVAQKDAAERSIFGFRFGIILTGYRLIRAGFFTEPYNLDSDFAHNRVTKSAE